MSTTPKIKPVDFEKTVMAKVKSNEISMKPRWCFILGSLFMVFGLIGLTIGVVFLTNVTIFLLRTHGPMGQWKLEQILTNFPLWVPVFTVLGIALGIWMLKKYDFSYKNNFWLIVVGFVFSILLGAFILDHLGFNDIWSRQGPMKRFYQQIEKGTIQKNPEQRLIQGRGRKH